MSNENIVKRQRFREIKTIIPHGEFLSMICKFGYYQHIVEIGVQFGDTTVHLCEAAKMTNGKVFGYDFF